MTDVTGFGLLGHGLELARGERVSLDINYKHIPFLSSGGSAGRSRIRDRRVGAQLGELWR